ncbi:hypothetical protein [Haloarchaeobius sp. HRN-SO-5]|uniref:hypothetical protein n=1 Tax=Haloarchaeobius sp. HRN-SO-5 TaxID=3446118 RepID=UPI003EC0AA6F
MSWALLELLPELLPIVGYSLVGAALTVLGAVAELESWHTFLADGVTILTAWYAVIGLLFLYAAVYVVGYEELVPRVRRIVTG